MYIYKLINPYRVNFRLIPVYQPASQLQRTLQIDRANMPGTLQIVSQYGARALYLLQGKYNFRSVVAGVTINRLRSLY